MKRLQLNPNVSKLHHVTLARHKFVPPALVLSLQQRGPNKDGYTE